jgi:hypothetical protein
MKDPSNLRQLLLGVSPVSQSPEVIAVQCSPPCVVLLFAPDFCTFSFVFVCGGHAAELIVVLLW